MSSDIAIKVENLSKCYHIYEKPGDRLMQMLMRGRKQYFREFWALKDVSFEIKKGETVGVIGRNGSGKSTLLQMICGTLNPTSGSIHTNGRIAALLELGSGFNPEFTGRENIYLNGSILGMSNEEIDSRMDSILSFADIGDFIDQPVKTYSSGMYVRLAFSIQANIDPDILIVDEALAVGDAAFQFKCLDRLKTLTQHGTTLLFVSHDIHMVKSFCNRAIYLQNGLLKMMGLAEELAEYYIMDIRDEQQRYLGKQATRFVIKPKLNMSGKFAFGTSQGCILNAKFLETGLPSALFSGDEIASIYIEANYISSLVNPHISIVLQNYKMVELAGKSFPVTSFVTEEGNNKARLVCTLPIILGNGKYYITIRLDSWLSQTEHVPIDKQVGVLAFEVVRVTQNFLGPVNIEIRESLEDDI